MFRYRLHSPDGDDLGEATYAMMIKPGEEILGSGGQRLPRPRRCPVRGGGRVAVRRAATGRGGVAALITRGRDPKDCEAKRRSRSPRSSCQWSGSSPCRRTRARSRRRPSARNS